MSPSGGIVRDQDAEGAAFLLRLHARPGSRNRRVAKSSTGQLVLSRDILNQNLVGELGLIRKNFAHIDQDAFADIRHTPLYPLPRHRHLGGNQPFGLLR